MRWRNDVNKRRVMMTMMMRIIIVIIIIAILIYLSHHCPHCKSFQSFLLVIALPFSSRIELIPVLHPSFPSQLTKQTNNNHHSLKFPSLDHPSPTPLITSSNNTTLGNGHPRPICLLFGYIDRHPPLLPALLSQTIIYPPRYQLRN